MVEWGGFHEVSSWSVNVGTSYRNLGGVSWAGRPAFGVADFALPSDRRPSSGSAHGFQDRFYSDGFVRPDSGTPIDGNTGYWGYQSGSQVQGGYLVFHDSSGTSHTLVDEPFSADHHSRLDGAAPFVQFQWTAVEKHIARDAWRLGLTADVSLLSSSYDHQTNTLQAQWNQYAVNATDRYNLGGIAPPPAPYTGDTSGTGTLIPAAPESRSTRLSLLDTHTFTTQTTQSLDLLLTSVSLGTTVEWRRDDCFGLLFSMGLALNVANWDAHQVDTLSRDGSLRLRLQSHSSGTDVLPGLFLQAGGEARVGAHVWLKVFGRYDWSEGVHASVGTSSVAVDPSGWTVGASVEWRF